MGPAKDNCLQVSRTLDCMYVTLTNIRRKKSLCDCRTSDDVYNATASVFGNSIDIQYYGRGLSDVDDGSPSGFWDTGWCESVISKISTSLT